MAEFLGAPFRMEDYEEWILTHPVGSSIRLGMDPLVRCEKCQRLWAPTIEEHAC